MIVATSSGLAESASSRKRAPAPAASASAPIAYRPASPITPGPVASGSIAMTCPSAGRPSRISVTLASCAADDTKIATAPASLRM